MLLDKALSYPQIEPLERAELLSMMAIEHAWDGALIEALTVLDEALSLFKASGALEKLTWEKGNRGILLMSASRIDEAIVDLEDAKETLADDPWPRCEVHVNMCLGEAYIHKGDLEKAWSALERSRELTAILGNYYQLSWVHYYRAMIRTFEGDLGSSMEEARMSRSYAQKYDYPFMVTMPNFLLVHLMSRTGDIKEAVSLCQETADILSGPRLDTHSPIYALAHLGRAELFSAMDDKDRAGREYQKALKELVSVQYSPFYTAITRTWYGQTLLSEGAVDEAFGNLHLAKRFFESVGNELFSSRISEMMEGYISH
jgi:tetratricopeptide (TPR) repeat protein